MADFSTEIEQKGFDLNGCTLVEASAGTGKTYNIQNAYLRLVVEHDLRVDQVLVVTFTEAATHELRERLRRILKKGRDFLENRLAEDDEDLDRIEKIIGIARSDNVPDADILGRLRLALMDFDNAAIFTIHGFCKRVLERYAFECGHDPSAELVADDTRIIQGVCFDWWRQHTYLDERFRETIPFKDPAELQAYLREYLSRPDAGIKPPPADSPLDLRNAARALSEGMNELERISTGPDSEYQEPRNSARTLIEKHLPALQELVSAENADIVALRTFLEDMRDCLQKAKWKRPVRDFPAELSGLIPECLTAWEAIGNLRGSIEWKSRCVLQQGAESPVDVSALAGLIHRDRQRLRHWLENPSPRIARRKAVAEFVSALGDLTHDSFEWPVEGDAKPFCRKLKALALQPEEVFVPSEEKLMQVSPELHETIHSLRQSILASLAGILESLAVTVRRNVRERGALTYDDLLRNVRDALRDERVGQRLKDVLRAEFRAALIDEFQDTDPVQYGIFDILFTRIDMPILFVGDPKQAIYGFRGADVFTYYRARSATPLDRRHDLKINHRSEKLLVSGINELFRDGAGRTFIHEAISYDGELGAAGVPPGRELLLNGNRDGRPLKIHTYNSQNIQGESSEFARGIYADTADGIVRLIEDKNSTIGKNRIRPGDVAVLVCTHNEADHVHDALKERGVNSIRQSVGNVFDSMDAREMAVVMKAMLEPADAGAVRGALATALLPCSPADLYLFATQSEADPSPETDRTEGNEKAPRGFDDWLEILKASGDRWRRRSFIEAFHYLVNRLDLKAHVVGLPDGERRLTNMLHLAELAHRAAVEFQQAPASLVSWFNRQLDADTREENEQYEMRLTSDDDAVHILTVFKSKGLEFPVVFLPTLWRREAKATHAKDCMLSYHDHDNNLVMDLDRHDEASRESAKNEALQENMRLVYVAVTRAVNRVCLVNVTAGDPDAYALQRLVENWRDRTGGNAESFIEHVALDQEEGAPFCLAGEMELETELCTPDDPRVDKSHGHTSFSELAPGAREVSSLVQRDIDLADEQVGDELAGQVEVADDIFSIPGGARTGECWHRIFERIDFQNSPDEQNLLVNQELERFRICNGPTDQVTETRKTAVRDMVQRVLGVSLRITADGDTFCLRDIPLSARRSEMPFNFSLKQHGTPVRTTAVRDILKQHWGNEADRQPFLAVMDSWDRQIPAGFMTGIIDLVCCHNDRFYILDWKSNRRSGAIGDFAPAGLRDEMAKHAYFLQYLVYTVAVHGFLCRELREYSYERNFGGVFYVFLRGVTGEPDSGIFADRPGLDLITDLTRVLCTGKGGVQ